MRSTPLILAGLLAAAVLPAQTQNVAWAMDNSPTLGGGNAFPWGSDGIRYQCIIPGSLFNNRPAVIQDILVAGKHASLSQVEVVYGDIEILVGVTQLGSVTANWTQNNPQPVTAYRGPLRVKYITGQWHGIGLPRSFVFLPKSPADNLCFEVIVWSVKDKGLPITTDNFYYPLTCSSTSPGGDLSRAYLYQWVQKGGYPAALTPTTSGGAGKLGFVLGDGNVVVVGTGCTGSSLLPLELAPNPGAWPQLGKPFTVNLQGAAPGTPALLGLGLREGAWLGVPLPIDLGPLGAPGCSLYHDLLTFLAAPVFPSGTASLPLAIPMDAALYGARFNCSWLNIDPKGNSLGITTSSYARLILGN